MLGENVIRSGAGRAGLRDGWLVLGLSVMVLVAGEGCEISSPKAEYGLACIIQLEQQLETDCL